MALNMVGRSQVKDKAIQAKHIDTGAINETHLRDGAVKNNHLNVDWSLVAPTIMSAKKIIDYVQPDSVDIGAGKGSVVVTHRISTAPAADAGSLGVIVTEPHNKVIIRQFEDVEKAINDVDGAEVKGRLTHDGADYTINFYTVKAGVETPYTFPENDLCVFQYPQRFDLSTVSETFGVNEKFVDNTIDVSTHFNLSQIAADVFGPSYTLNKDGIATLAAPLEKRISDAEALIAQHATDNDSYHALLLGRIEVLETAKDQLQKDLDALQTQVDTSVKVWKRIDKQFTAADVLGDVTAMTVGEGILPVGEADVYVNGMLQMVNVHYVEIDQDGFVTSIEFAPEKLVDGDVVQVRWLGLI